MVKFQPLDRIDRRIAIILFAITLAGYLRLAAPDLLPGDPGEFQVAAWKWGLAHPTGYPLYLLIGGVWQRLLALVGISPAASLNALSAFFGASAVAMLYLVARFWLWGPLLVARVAGLLAALFLATNPTFWSQSLIAEVYPLHVLLILAILRVAQGLEIADETYPIHSQRRRLLLLFFLVGLSLTHHGMTLFLVPGLLVYLWLVERSWYRSPGLIVATILAGVLPLLLYLYVPLRSGAGASPWYHQRLGEIVLTLYTNDLAGFLDFVSGQSISVGFNGLLAGLGNLGQALLLWRVNLNWPGMVLAVAGLAVLAWQRRWPVLALTALYALFQQLFNLFYGIGDILVYYVPIYAMAAIWIGFAGQATGLGFDFAAEPEDGAEEDDAEAHEHQVVGDGTGQAVDLSDDNETSGTVQVSIGLLFLLLLFLLPLRTARTYSDQLDQSESRGARLQWEEIMAANLPENAVLISNDRNEIVPLFYLQHVEGRGLGMTGLFPLLKPEPDFADIGATVDTALRDSADQPIYLIKEMAGLDIKYALATAMPPLVQVIGPAVTAEPGVTVEAPLGPLTLVGYDWQESGDGLRVTLQWRVDAALDANYTTSVQLYAADGNKIGQHDRASGGRYYPTSLWKPGELLLDPHRIDLPADALPTELLISMYVGPDFEQLAEPLRIRFDAE